MTCRASGARGFRLIPTQRFRIGLIHRSAPPARDSGFWEAQKYRRFCSIVFAAARTDGAFKEAAPEARNRGSAQSRQRWVGARAIWFIILSPQRGRHLDRKSVV